MTWQLAIVGLAGLAVGLTAGYALRGLTLDATWALVVEGWEDLTNVRRQLAAAEADLTTARTDAAFHKARVDAAEDLLTEAREDLSNVRRQLATAETELKAAWTAAVTHKARADGIEARASGEPCASASGEACALRPVGMVSAPAIVEPYIVPLNQKDADARKRPKGTLYVVRLTEDDGGVSYWPREDGSDLLRELSNARKYAHAAEAFEARAVEIARNGYYPEALGDVLDVVAIPPGYVEAAR